MLLENQHQILEGIHYRSRNLIRVEIRDGMISSMEGVNQPQQGENCSVSQLPVIAPGLVDLQINGYKGVDFNDPALNTEQIESASENLLNLGVSCYYPTLITGSKEKTSSLIRTFAEAMGQKGLSSRMIGGIHLEGPFICTQDGPRGAHSRSHCLEPDLRLLQEWQELAEGKIKILTLAPELPGSEKLISSAVEMGMVVGIGHTAARSEDIIRAADAGASLSTHLGNGCHNMLPRHPNFIWDQLAEDRLYASIIADGFHLPDAVLKVFTWSKGTESILISDGMPYTGLAPGLYDSPATGRVRLTPEGKLHLEGKPGTLAGSASSLLEGIRKMIPIQGFPFAWDMASLHPQNLMKPGSSCGLEAGAPANLVLLDPASDAPEILQVYLNGI